MPVTVLEALLPQFVETELLRCLLESSASEHGARMSAMDKASSNASEMIDKTDPAHEQNSSGQHHEPDHRDRVRGERMKILTTETQRSQRTEHGEKQSLLLCSVNASVLSVSPW